MASYYLCTPGEVYNAAVPAGLRPDSETVVWLSDGYAEGAPLSPKAQAALDALATFPKPPTVAELERRAGVRNLLPTLTTLVAEGAVHVDAEVKAGITPRRETFVRLAADYPDEESLRPLFDTLRRAASQERLLLHFLDAAQPFSPDGRQEVSRKELLATSGASAALLTALVRRGVLTLVERTVEPQPLFLDRVTQLGTDATVDLLRLAGLKQVGLCCEVMREDGTMMRTSELLPAPLRPMMPNTSPGWMRRLTPCSARTVCPPGPG